MARKKEDVTSQETVKDVDSAVLTKALIKDFNKDQEKTGKLAWSLATDLDNPTEVKEWISTGSTLLNYIISNKRDGGIPVGKLSEFSGEEASGKSLLCMHLAAEVQKRGGIVVYIDTENALNPEFCTQIGVDLTKLVYLQPGTCEEVGAAIVRTITMVRQKAPNKLCLIVWDGIAATPTTREIEGAEGALNMNDQLEKSKVLSRMMRQVTQTLGKERIALVFTNQLKTKIGVMYGDPMTTPGGKAVPYHASVRVKLTRGNTEKDKTEGGEDVKGSEILGVNTNAKVIKNRMGPPLRKARFFISFARGIEDVSSWFLRLHEAGLIEKSGGWCYIPQFTEAVKERAKKVLEELKQAGMDKELIEQTKKFVNQVLSEDGYKFREKQWEDEIDGTPFLREWVLDTFEKIMVVKYGEMPRDAELDTESVMEVEQTVQDLINPE
jgi:recombination protein RecA